MQVSFRWTIVSVALWSTFACAFGAPPNEPASGPIDLTVELPRVPPKEPAAALETFQLKPGYRIEQVAAEPLVTSPVAMAFDENGRLFVAEMRGYPDSRDRRDSRVRMLTDANSDGRFDHSSVYADDLRWATAVACWDGGIFVADAPDVWYFKDTSGDGSADVRRKVFTGFADSNPDGLLNSFNWTLDNRIAIATSSGGGAIVRLDDQGAATSRARPVSIRGRNVALDPRSLAFELTSGASQHGLTVDDWGHTFVCSSSSPVKQVMYEDRYLAAAPYVIAPSSLVEISGEVPREVFRTSAVETWRVLRTRMRVAGLAQGPIEAGGQPSGYFTSATGVTIYRGTALHDEMRGMVILGDVAGNLVHRKRLSSDNLPFAARRVDQQSEWLTSTDNWFRPVQFANGPDGGLYIADMYRELVENPSTIPPAIVRQLDPGSGRDRGRIYRVVGQGFSQPALPRLREAATPELVALLEHRNAWHRQTAARLLYERQDRAAVPLLRTMAAGSGDPIGRLQALYALDGMQALDAAVVVQALADNEPGLREHGVRLSERLGDWPEDLCRRLYALTEDDALAVRYQLAFTLGLMPADSRRDSALLRLARRDGDDAWMRFAMLLSMSQNAAAVFDDLVADPSIRRSKSGRSLIAELAAALGHQGAPLPATFTALREDQALVQVGVRGYAVGLAGGGRSPLETLSGDAATVLKQVIEESRAMAADDQRSLKSRRQAIDALPLGDFADSRELIAQLLNQRQPQEVQVAALGALEKFKAPGVAPLLLEAWPTLGPRTRTAAAEALLARPERVAALLDAVEQGKFEARALEAPRRQLLLQHPDSAIRARAAQLLSQEQLGRRQDVVESYRGALQLSGDAARGRAVFEKNCSACHRDHGLGHEIGPNLSAVKNRGAEFILTNVLDPNREVNPQYVNYLVVIDEGRTLTGIISGETAAAITLRRGEGATDIVPRGSIEQLQSTGLSLMPEGLEQQLDQQAMADLITYVLELK